MPILPTYPGIYIEELPSSTHTITPAPTSIAVFVGYSHPLKTKTFNQPFQIFSFTDYERAFGGFFANAIFDSTTEKANFGNLAYAVNQFFLNGGTNAYVVGLEAKPSGSAIVAATATVSGITFTAQELTDADHEITVTISNAQSDGTADIMITYGSGPGARVETYRKVSIQTGNANFIETRIGATPDPTSTTPPPPPVSSLVTVKPSGASYPTTFTDGSAPTSPSPASGPIFNVGDFTAVFQQDSPLDKLPIFNILVIPGVTNNLILSEAIAFCEQKRAFFIMEAPNNAVASPVDVTTSPATIWVGDYMGGTNSVTPPPKSTNTALYFPYIVSTDPLTGSSVNLPPGGTIAGIYARTDTNRGVWKAPAGLETTLVNVTGVVPGGIMNDVRQGTLNPLGVNCLRTFPGIGTVVFGARTSVTANSALQQWRYVPVRRMALFIEQTLYNNLGWVIFEPNDDPLWVAIRTNIENFMLSLFSQGAFQGSTPSQAFQVKCDASTTTQTDIDNGIVNIIVAFAPLKPAEFVIIKIAQLAGQTQL